MRQISKAFSKKLFGAHYEQLKRVLPVWLILFFGFYLSDIRMRIAPSVLYLTVFSFCAGIMWRLLTSESATPDMQQLCLLPFNNRSFVFSYIAVLGAYTLLTKAAGLLAILLALCPWSKTEILNAFLCSVFAVLMTACFYVLTREKAAPGQNQRPLGRIAYFMRRAMSVFWLAAFLAAILLQSDLPAVLSFLKTSPVHTFHWQTIGILPIIIGACVHAGIMLSDTDAYTFYGRSSTHIRRVRSGRHALAWRYLTRYLLSHKNYLLNTVVLWGIAGVLPVFFTQVSSSFAGPTSAFILPIGFAVLSLNTPLCILLSCDPAFEQALRFLPHPARMFLIPYCLFIFIFNLGADAIFLCSYALQSGGVHPLSCLSAAVFALSGALGSVLLEWYFPLRGWKTENDLWHHPRKYIVPVTLFALAGIMALF